MSSCRIRKSNSRVRTFRVPSVLSLSNRISVAVASLLAAAICSWLLFAELPNAGGSEAGEKVSIVELAAPKKASGISAPVSSSAFPELIGRVNDHAAMLNASQKAELEERLAEFERKSSDQLVVATLVTLGSQNLEDYANRLFRHWQLGQAQENNGVLLLIVRDDRKIRIEVGYGLEGTLTDALSKVIIDQVIVPSFKAGEFGNGIVEGADMILRVLSGDVAELEARKQRDLDRSKNVVDVGFWIFFLVWGILFFGPITFAILAPIFGKKLGKGRYRWLGIDVSIGSGTRGSSGSYGGGWSGGSSGGGFSGGGGSSGGGGASGGW